MYKFVLFLLLFSFLTFLYALQTDEQRAMQALFEGKRAVNRAAHAAAQQVDTLLLAGGTVRIDPLRSQAVAMDYLRSNLRLDADNKPVTGSFWRAKIEVAVFEIVNDSAVFPYTYTNATFGYSVTLDRPGVILIIRLEYPRLYRVISPIEWTIKGAAELVY